MNEAALKERSGNKCELCSSLENLAVCTVNEEHSLYTCEVCLNQINNPDSINPNHWRCLSESLWSEFSAVKIVAYRMLRYLKDESWAVELLSQIYLEESDKVLAESQFETDEQIIVKDSNGTRLNAGDSVTLIKDLDVKGAGFTAKRGTLVKNISLTNNPEHIEGRANGVHIVLVAKFLKKV